MDVRELSVINLAHQCQEETARYLRRESGEGVCCFELFRRAVADRDDQAWERVVIQYRRMVLAWVRRHPTRALVNESDDDWVHDAFARFWKAVPPDRFAMFPNLAAILRYLKLCVHSSLMDEARASEAQRAAPIDDAVEMPGPLDVEGAALSESTALRFWQSIQAELQDEVERLVVYLSFALDLKPGEIQARYPEHYASVADVYRVKRNVLERLRRSDEIRAFLG